MGFIYNNLPLQLIFNDSLIQELGETSGPDLSGLTQKITQNTNNITNLTTKLSTNTSNISSLQTTVSSLSSSNIFSSIYGNLIGMWHMAGLSYPVYKDYVFTTQYNALSQNDNLLFLQSGVTVYIKFTGQNLPDKNFTISTTTTSGPTLWSLMLSGIYGTYSTITITPKVNGVTATQVRQSINVAPL